MLLEHNGIDNHYWKHLNDLDLDEKESFHEVNVVANKNLTKQELSYNLNYYEWDHEQKQQSTYCVDILEYPYQTIYIQRSMYVPIQFCKHKSSKVLLDFFNFNDKWWIPYYATVFQMGSYQGKKYKKLCNSQFLVKLSDNCVKA